MSNADQRDPDVSPYRGLTLAVGTLHGKERQFAAAFRRWHAVRVEPSRAVDTDGWGTFTGEVARTLAPTEAARAKAEAAANELKTPIGLGTEASYSPGYAFGPHVHEEVVVLLDRERDICIVEKAHQFTAVAPPRTARTRSGAESILRSLGAPYHGTIIRGSDGSTIKGVRALDPVVALLGIGPVTIEPDLRAHMNPPRQRVLRRLAWRLAARMSCRCPDCATPGYGVVGIEAGLPCAFCDTPTNAPRADVWGCPSCPSRESRARAARSIDPSRCDVCNP